MNELLSEIRTAIIFIIFMTVITGILYPGVITGVAQSFFPWRAGGSLLWQEQRLIGSELIGQSFTDPKYFWSRPSATPKFPYNSTFSSSGNYGPMNETLLLAVKDRSKLLHFMNPKNNNLIPVDLVTASGSGVDPDISPYAAEYQINRISKLRRIPAEKITKLISTTTKKRMFYILGEPRVNVLQLNIALDALDKNLHPKVQ